MSRCEITSEGAALIANTLSENTTLKALDISDNLVGHASAAALINKTRLEALDLSFSWAMTDFYLGFNGLCSLFEALKNNTYLKELELSSRISRLSPKELQSFKEALEKNTTLQSLSLKHFRLSPQIAQILADIIKNTQVLQKLDLSYTLDQRPESNPLSRSMVKTLITALESRA